ncbi:MAG: MaoC/PaaZ C-terminal domain-containing protein [Gammaproteobacteria bacterium]|nr:MaoC/PaaZ C-terminal domain-containing protein [Gammaproteobacteria bacterium]
MPLSPDIVGRQTRSFEHHVDARWLMAYAAGLADFSSSYMSTDVEVIVAHPVFPVCLEWPAILDCANLPSAQLTTAAERARGVHAAHDLHIYRPIRAGEVLTTTATVIGVRQISPGAAQTIRLDTVDDRGELVCRTYQLGISRGVEVDGESRKTEFAPAVPDLEIEQDRSELQSIAIPVAAEAAHVYTECARIWNPIHTDRAVALAAGLPDIILHGTATLALAVSRIVERVLGGDPTRVRRLGGRFSAMVLMPSTLQLAIRNMGSGLVSFTVRTENDQLAFSEGFLCFE